MHTSPFDQSVIFLYTEDMEATTEFYEKIMGLPRVLEQTGCRLWRISDTSFVGFCTKFPGVGTEGVCITFVTEDVEGVCEKLRAKGVVFEKEPAENPQ